MFSKVKGTRTEGEQPMTSKASNVNKKFSATEEALEEASKLLTRLCKSRKAGMKLPQIIDLTGKVASLSRSLHLEPDRDNDGYGDPNHFAKMSQVERKTNLIR